MCALWPEERFVIISQILVVVVASRTLDTSHTTPIHCLGTTGQGGGPVTERRIITIGV
jgi:hypothetical protein